MNRVLEQAKSDILKEVVPHLVQLINDLTDTGKSIMYDETTRHMTTKALRQTDPAKIGESFAGLTLIVHGQNPGVPMNVILPTAMMLLCEGLNSMEEAGVVKVDKPFLAAATKSMYKVLMEELQATPDKLQGMVDKEKSAQPSPATPQPGILAQGAM